ncbi:siderophore biosynthesis protein [Parasalinivibrio latis]|uniref:IucA/IucC family protein n=1 Tax=Parasalinivibrio latis TaxID=2952610 RepID=UPI0030E370FA
MIDSSRLIAEQASFRAFLNCYLREVDPGVDCRHTFSNRVGKSESADCFEFSLLSVRAKLRVGIEYFSLTGCHRFGKCWVRQLHETMWQETESFSVMLMLVQEIYRSFCEGDSELLRVRELELIHRLTDSYKLMADYVEAQHRGISAGDSFIDGEQACVFGHWLHPTPKSRQGMAEWHQPAYAPELSGEFQLHYFAANSEIVHQNAARSSVEEIVSSMLGDASQTEEPGQTCLIPMHPLQAQTLLLAPDICDLIQQGSLAYLGPMGREFTPTSSVRTLYSRDCPWMVKFSIPVRITNSVRRNRRHELEAGVMMDKLMAETGFAQSYPCFRMIHDPAYITLNIPGREERESGFEVIFRDNPFMEGKERGIVTIASLTAEAIGDMPSRLAQILLNLTDETLLPVDEVCRIWFRLYLDCSVKPLITLYDRHGIALEAHQQNSVLDVSEGYPSAYYYRDNQGFYLSERYRETLSKMAPEAGDIASLYFEDREIRDRFSYYLVVNQVCSVISRMGGDGLIAEAQLVDMLRSYLAALGEQLNGAGKDLIHSLLTRKTIPAKGNLLTRLYDVDELEAENEQAIYTQLANPLTVAPVWASEPEEVGCAVA